MENKVEINKDLIKHVASLARLNLTEKELDSFTKELKEVIDMFQTISEVDVEDETPSIQPLSNNVLMREDKVDKTLMLSNEEALSLSSNKKDGYFKGPRAI